MRHIKIIMVVALIASLFGNFLLWKKQDRNRMQVKINDKVTTKREYYAWMDQYHGRETMRDLLIFNLVTEGAKKAGWKQPDAEIKQQLQDMQEADPRMAATIKREPWQMIKLRMKMELNDAMQFLQTKDVRATDDEIKEFFDQRPGQWNKPEKIYLKAVVAQDSETAERAKQLMSKVNDILVVQQQLQPKAYMLGADGTWVLSKPYGQPARDPMVNQLATQKPTPIRVIPPSQRLPMYIVIRKDKYVQGQKVEFGEVKDKVERMFKLQRATPSQEVLRKLWDEADIETDPPGAKDELKRSIFPNAS